MASIFEPQETQRVLPGALLKPQDGHVTVAAISIEAYNPKANVRKPSLPTLAMAPTRKKPGTWPMRGCHSCRHPSSRPNTGFPVNGRTGQKLVLSLVRTVSAHAPQQPLELEFAPDRDQVDPELLELPDPPRKERRTTSVLLAVVAVASLAMVGALSRDATYSLATPTPTELGDLQTASADGFVANSYVQGEGRLGGVGALRYEHPFESDTYRLAPVAGRADVWVEVRVPAGEESSRYVPGTKFQGRLIPFDQSGLRHRGIASSVESLTGQAVPQKAWLLVDGQAPNDSRGIVALCVMFLGFAVWNVLTLLRLRRKVK
jgi:hypothetical protein